MTTPDPRVAPELPPGVEFRDYTSLPPEHFTLTDRVRDLVAATLMTAVDADELAAVTGQVQALTARLQAHERANKVVLVQRPDGTLDNLSQAGTGELNPQALRLRWLPAEGGDDVRGVVTLTAAHVGPPERAHGGIVCVILDQLLGMACWAAGRPGMTVSVTINLKQATPLNVPLDLRGRFTGEEGRKRFAEGEIYADGVLTASATGIFVSVFGGIADVD
jgi:acyl-coenzyme A thioesterase PaaI-like protein